MQYEIISFDLWKQYARNYIIEYIKTHRIYKHIPPDVSWDRSGSVEEVTKNIINYISSLEQEFYDENFLCTLYNGNSRASYVSGCGLFYETFSDAIFESLKMELFSKILTLNNITNEDDENYDKILDFVCDIEKEWIFDIIEEFTKEKVVQILKNK